MIKRIVCGVFAVAMSCNAFSSEVFSCYEKLECPKENDFYACKRVGENAGMFASGTPVIIGSLKKGTHHLERATVRGRSMFPASCDYGDVVINSGTRVSAYVLPNIPSKWVWHGREDYDCSSSDPKECAFINYG